MTHDDAWFAPHTYGIGFRPARWPGWVATGGYVALAFALMDLPHRTGALRWVLLGIVTAGYLVLAARHTPGGMRWRWGGER